MRFLRRPGANVVACVRALGASQRTGPSWTGLSGEGRVSSQAGQPRQTEEPLSRDTVSKCRLETGLRTWSVATRLFSFMRHTSTSRSSFRPVQHKGQGLVWRLPAPHLPPILPLARYPPSGPQFPLVGWMWHLRPPGSCRRVTVPRCTRYSGKAAPVVICWQH